MPEVVQPRSTAHTGRPKPRLARQLIERPMHPAAVQPCALGGDKQVVRIAQPEEVFAPTHVLREHGTRGRMQRHQPRSAQLGGVDGQYGLLQVDVAQLQIQSLGDA